MVVCVGVGGGGGGQDSSDGSGRVRVRGVGEKRQHKRTGAPPLSVAVPVASRKQTDTTCHSVTQLHVRPDTVILSKHMTSHHFRLDDCLIQQQRHQLLQPP